MEMYLHFADKINLSLQAVLILLCIIHSVAESKSKDMWQRQTAMFQSALSYISCALTPGESLCTAAHVHSLTDTLKAVSVRHHKHRTLFVFNSELVESRVGMGGRCASRMSS